MIHSGDTTATVSLTFNPTEAQARALRRAACAQKITFSDNLRRTAGQAAVTALNEAKFVRPDFTARSRKILGNRASETINVLDFLD